MQNQNREFVPFKLLLTLSDHVVQREMESKSIVFHVKPLLDFVGLSK